MVEEEPDVYGGETEMVWIANFTGNEDLPETISAKQWSGGRWAWANIPNPLRKKKSVERLMDGGMKEYTAKDGAPEAHNLGKIPFRLPAFTRRLYPKHLAAWSLHRDAVSDVQGSIIKSRAPSSFEPTLSWSLDDMRGYLRLIDPDAKVGPSEHDVRERAAKDPEAARAGESGLQAYVDEAKKVLDRRIFFRVADPQYHRPTREEFSEFMAGESPVQKSDTDAVMDMLIGSADDAIGKAKKKRGRPAGSKNKPKVSAIT